MNFESVLMGVFEQRLVDKVLDVLALLDDIDRIIADNIYIAGGAIADAWQDKNPKNIDVYFKSFSVIDNFLEILSLWKDNRPEDDRIFISDNAVTFNFSNTPVQFVTCVAGSPELVLSAFDFVHTQGYIDLAYLRQGSKGFVYCTNEFVTSCNTKELEYVGSTYPLDSLRRAFKFVSRGWKLSYESMLRLVFDVGIFYNPLTLLDEEVVIEAMNGWYFNDLTFDVELFFTWAEQRLDELS